MTKHINSYIMRFAIVLCLILISVESYSQVIIGDPVYKEDFGSVPSDWNSKGDKYRASGNISSYREEVGNRVDGCGYTFGERFKALFAWRNASLSEAPAWNAFYYGNGKYAVGISGDELGEGTFKSWHNDIDHTGNTNGMAFVANAKTEKGSLVFYKTLSALEPGKLYRLQAYVGNGENGTGKDPEIKMLLENGVKENYKQETITASKSAIPWIEYNVFLDIPLDGSFLKYTFYSMNDASLANIFIIDDISLSPVTVRADIVNVDFCSEPSKVWFEAVVADIPEGVKMFTRLMRRSKLGGNWEWDNQTGVTDSLKTYTTEENYNNYDYRLVVGLTESVLQVVPENGGNLNEYGTFSITSNFIPSYTCEAWSNFEMGLDFCTDPARAVFKADRDLLPVAAPVFSRLMQRPRESEAEWYWKNEVSDSLDVRTDALDYLTFEYQMALEVAVPDLLNKETPRVFLESGDHGCFTVKNIFRNDFCLELFGADIEYALVQDSVVISPQMVLGDREVYLRWLFRPFGAKEWTWLGDARPLAENKLDWITFTTGDFRCVYGMNPALLNAMPCEQIGTKDYYYVASEEEAIKGIPLAVGIQKSFVGGGVRLEATTEKMPSMVTSVVKGCWIVREKGTIHWEKLEGFEQRMGIPEYIRNEYMFVASMSQAVMDTLNFDGLTRENPTYWLSDTVRGETVSLKENLRNFCEEPGEVVMTADFSSEGIPADMLEIGRWRQREKGTEAWSWISNFSGIKPLQVSMADYLSHDYQLVVAWSTDSLDVWANNGLPLEQNYYLLEDQFLEAGYCLTVDTIRVVSTGRDLLELQPELVKEQSKWSVYGRWMRREKGEMTWNWANEIQTSDYSLTVSTDDFGRFDYRFCAALSAVVPEQEPARLEAQPYLAIRELEGKTVYEPEWAAPVVSCVAHQDVNEAVLAITVNEGIRSLVYRFGEGENTKLVTAGQQELRFVIDRDTVFHLLSYAQEGICDSIIREEAIVLKYIPKLQITRFTDVFGCHNTVQLVKPLVVGGTKVDYQWIKGEEMVEVAGADSLKVVFGDTGKLPLKLTVSDEGWCPEDSTVFLITGEYPKITYTSQLAPKELCVGQSFDIGYDFIDADQYRISLSSTDMPGFIFYPGSGSVKETENGILEIKTLQTLLTATEFMVGYEFTFHIQIFKTAQYRGVSYQCEDGFDYRFKVRPTIESRYPSNIKLCNRETLNLTPELELNGNEVSIYRWQLWDGMKMEGQELKNSEKDMTLELVADGGWNGKRLQLTALCACGEVVVQDMNLLVFVGDSNRITGPDYTVLAGEKTSINGSEVKLKDLSYFWESREGLEAWRQLPQETGTSIYFYAPDTTTEYRRTLAGEGWNCPDMQAGPVRLRVYDNERENRIYVLPQDSLITLGQTVTIHSDSQEREDVTYSWEKYESGVWREIEGTGRELTYAPEGIVKFRRIALVGEKVLYSNEVWVNVYDNGQNRILLASGVITPGQKVKVIGNYVDVPGVVYRWFADSGEGWQQLAGQGGYNLEIAVGKQTKLMRYVYLPGEKEDSLASNEVVAYVFDNAADNQISSESIYVCADEEVAVAGKKVNGDGISYRWEYSLDQGNNWIILNKETEAGYTFIADRNLSLRRRILYTGAPEWYSNILHFSIVHNSADNQIEQSEIMVAGMPGTVTGTPVQDAMYEWEISKDGENNWQLIEGAADQDLVVGEELTREGGFVRRHLLFAGEAGCEGYSNPLALKIFDPESGNVITGPGNYVCQWSGFTITGTDMSSLNARYQWYRNENGTWEPLALSISKDLTVYEGCGRTTQFRRDATIGDMVNESNVVEIRLWDDVNVENKLKQPGIACAGQNVVIQGSDALGGEVDLSGYIKSYSWEVSTTGAGGTWKVADSTNTRDLMLEQVENSQWYCRVIRTYCGTDLRSQPLLLDVHEKLRFTLRNDAPFNPMNPKNPICISVDEDYFDAYEIKIDEKILGTEPEYLFYGWMPKKDYQVVVNVVSSTGCSQTDTMRLRTPDVDLPNVLTPNNDGYNDVLLAGYDLKVYNRWGNLLYAGQDGWDGRYKGTLVSAGTYFYILKITHMNGVLTEYKKSVTVKRDKN